MSKGKKSKVVSDGANWDEGLVKEQLKDDKWQPFVVILAPEDTGSLPLIQSVVSAVETRCRRRFYAFTKESVFAIAKEDNKLASAGGTGGGGGRKSKQSTPAVPKPLHSEVCQHVTTALAGGEMTLPLVARMLKYILLKRRAADLAAKQSAPKETDEKPTKTSAKGKTSAMASKKGKVTPADVDRYPMPQKGLTTMKKRGEDSESQYIDDEPDPGPSSYIILTGFNEADLLPHLAEVGVTVDVLIKMSNSSQSETDSAINEHNDMLQCEIATFWRTVNKVIHSTVAGSMLRDIAILDHICAFDSESKDMGLDIFSQLAERVYTILKCQEQYQHYLRYLDVKCVPLSVTSETEQPDDFFYTLSEQRPKVDMRYYNEQLDKLPQEVIGPALIMKNMLNQIELSLTANTQPAVDSLHFESQTLLDNISSSLASATTAKDSHVPVINGQDYSQLAHVKFTDDGFPEHHPSFIKLFTPPLLPASLSLSYQKQLNSLRQFTSSVPQLQVDAFVSALLAMMSMEHIQPPTLNEEPSIDLSLDACNLLFDYPLDIKLGDESPNNTTTISCVDESSSDSPSIALQRTLILPMPFDDLSNYSVLEPLSQRILLQVIQRLFSTHPYIKIYHQKLTNSLVVAMYSGYCKDGGKYQWQRHTHSKVGFNNYLSHVALRVGSVVDMAVEEDAEIKQKIEQEQAKAKLEEKQETSITPQPESKSSSAKSGGKKSGNSSAKKGQKHATEKVTEADDHITSSMVQRKLYTGYDVGDKVLLGEGTVSTAFTYDGAHIISQQIQFAHSPLTLSVSLLHDSVALSGSFTKETDSTNISPVQAPSPEEPPTDESDIHVECESPVNPIPQPPKSVYFDAFNASLSGALTLAFSHFGSRGDGQLPTHPKSENRLQKLDQSRPDSSQTSRPSSQDKKVSKKQQEENQRLLEQQQALDSKNREIILHDILREKKAIFSSSKHQKLSLTTSHGLYVTCSTIVDNISTDGPGSIVITQQYLASLDSLSKEVSRVYLDDGSVVKTMSDGSICILCHDGRVYERLPATWKKSSAQDANGTACSNKVSFNNVEEGFEGSQYWVVTYPEGKRQVRRTSADVHNEESDNISDSNDEDNKKQEDDDAFDNLDSFHAYVIKDPMSQEVLLTREDNVMILRKPNGSMVVEHADGTRITSLPPSGYTFEHPLFSGASFREGECTLDLRPTAKVTCYSTGQYKVTDSIEDYSLSISAEGEVEYKSGQAVYTFCHSGASEILSAIDSAGVVYSVNSVGEIQIDNDKTDMPIPVDLCPHFFVIQQNGNGYEVHHNTRFRKLVDEARKSDKVQVIENSLSECSQCYSTILLSPLDEKSSDKVKEIVPDSLVASLNDQTVYRKVGKKRFGVDVGKSLNIGGKQKLEPVARFKEPHGYKQREFIHAGETSLWEAFKACLIKYLNWKQASAQKADSLSAEPGTNTGFKFLKGLSLSSKDLAAYCKVAWEAKNSSVLSCQTKGKMIARSIVEDVTDAEEARVKILKRIFPPYFQSHTGMEFLQSMAENATNSYAPDDISSVDNVLIPAPSEDAEVPDTSAISNPPTSSKNLKNSDVASESQQGAALPDSQMGFQLTPPEVKFGVLKEGCTYFAHCSLKNNGTGSSWCTMKTPPSSTGIKVVYTPGYVIAGTSRSFDVEIFAMATSKSQKHTIHHDLEIRTETGILYLPIQACVCSSSLFDQMYTDTFGGASSIVIPSHNAC